MPGWTLTLGEGLKEFFLRLNFRQPGSSTFADQSDDVFFWIYLISAFFFVLLMAMMVVFSFKYRKKPGQVPQRSAGHNTFLELSWSVIPTILLVWMFFKGFWGFSDILIAPSEAPEVMLTAKKWQWSVMYPNGAGSDEVTRTRDLSKPELAESVAETPIFYVPENQPIKFRMSSEDVIHSFWVPDMRAKFDVFPNRYTAVWFEPQKIKNGTPLMDAKNKPVVGADGKPVLHEDHWVFCAEYCGANHSEMSAVVRVVPASYFLEWVKAAATPKGAPWERGKKYFRLKGCNSCHTVDGNRNVGPTWKDMYGEPVKFADGGGRSAEQMTGTEFANYVRESVYTPAAHIVETFPNQMQSFQGRINEDELACLIAYMSSPEVNTKHPVPQLGEEAKPAEGTPGATGATGATGTPNALPPSTTPKK